MRTNAIFRMLLLGALFVGGGGLAAAQGSGGGSGSGSGGGTSINSGSDGTSKPSNPPGDKRVPEPPPQR